jgi:hypothetical protein
MVPTKNLLDHIEGLLRLSYDCKDRAVSAKLREMADELRILVSVADIANLAANLGPSSAAPAPMPASNVPVIAPDFVTTNEFVTANEPPAANEAVTTNELVAALYVGKPKRKRKPKESADEPDAPRPKRKAKKRAEPKD